jgi:surface antigen
VLGAAVPNGHVAYVQRVTSTGRTYISQMHAPTLGKVTYRWLGAARARTRGLTYIYR